jgi:hypothetical protein
MGPPLFQKYSWVALSLTFVAWQIKITEKLGHGRFNPGFHFSALGNGLEVLLETLQVLHQVQGKLHTGQVQTQIFHQVPDKKDLSYVFPGIEAQHSNGAAGVDEAQPLVLAESLGVHIQNAGGHADYVYAFHPSIETIFPPGFLPTLLRT